MQVQNISNNQQSFQGKVIPKNLSNDAHELISANYLRMQRLVEDKGFNLYLTEDINSRLLKFIVQRGRDFGKKNRPIMEVAADMRAKVYHAQAVPSEQNAALAVAKQPEKENLYLATAEYAVKEFEKIKPPETFADKCKRFGKKVFQKFMDIVQDKDEI